MRVIGKADGVAFVAHGGDRAYSIGRTLRHTVIELHHGGVTSTVRRDTAIFTDGPCEAWAIRWAQLYARAMGIARN